jgi:muconolactone delta-isomerase
LLSTIDRGVKSEIYGLTYKYYLLDRIMLYHLDFHVEYPATISQTDLFKIWVKEAEAALGAKAAGIIVDLWKCVGTRRIIAIVDVDSPDTLDRIILDLPIMKELGHHIQIEVTSLRRYEDFADDLKERSTV